jgi:hypothetical protein
MPCIPILFIQLSQRDVIKRLLQWTTLSRTAFLYIYEKPVANIAGTVNALKVAGKNPVKEVL